MLSMQDAQYIVGMHFAIYDEKNFKAILNTEFSRFDKFYYYYFD